MKQKSTKLLKKNTPAPARSPQHPPHPPFSSWTLKKKALIFLEKQCKYKTNFIIMFNC